MAESLCLVDDHFFFLAGRSAPMACLVFRITLCDRRNPPADLVLAYSSPAAQLLVQEVGSLIGRSKYKTFDPGISKASKKPRNSVDSI